jgi:hypothetical protein
MKAKAYQKASSRSDLSQVLVHFTKEKIIDPLTPNMQPLDVLHKILIEGKVVASTENYIKLYEPKGAACFYDVPYQNWPQLIETNPSGRRGYGIIVDKGDFWRKGGRPAIYTEIPESPEWPSSEKYRLSKFYLYNNTHISDWTHEREWRICSDFIIENVRWWPCVEKIIDAQDIFKKYNAIHTIYVIVLGRFLGKNEISF